MKNLVRPILIKAGLIYAGFFIVLCFHLQAFAEAADRDKPIELEADTVTVNDAKKISTYAGNVILTQGTLIIKADKLIVREDKEGFQHSTSTGNPTTFKQKREGVNEYMEGSAQRIEYDGRMDKVQLYTRAWVKRGEDIVHGDYISYDANAEYAEVIGGTKTENGVTSNGRVKAIIQPKNKPAQPKPSSQSESPQSEPSSGAVGAPAVTKNLRFSNKLSTTNNPEAQVSE
jgi:lipopolysaccharide export system protein LptA